MKKPYLLLVVSAGLLLAGCIDGGTNSSSQASSSSSSSSSSEASSITSESSSDSSSTSSEQPVPAPTVAELKTLANTAKEKHSLVSKGSIKRTVKSSWSEEDYTTPFELGTNDYGEMIHYKEEDYYGNEKDVYLFQDSEDSIVGVTKDASGAYGKTSSTPDEIGFAFDLYPLFVYSGDPYTVEDFAIKVLQYAELNSNKDFEAKLEDGKYSLSFGYFTGISAYTVTTNTMSFTIGSQGEITSLNVESAQYNSDFVIDDETETFTLSETATASNTYTFAITQEAGTRSLTLPFSINDFYYTSFAFGDSEGAALEGDTISVLKGESAYVTLINSAPTTASASFDEPEVTILSGNTAASYISAYYSSYSNNISISTYNAEAGTYVVQVKTRNVTKTFTVVVTNAAPEKISMVTYWKKAVDSYSSNYVEAGSSESIGTFVGSSLYLKVNVNPNAASQEVTATSDKSTATLTAKTITFYQYGAPQDVFEFVASEAGTYAVTFTSVEDTSISATFTVVVEEKPTFAELLSKTYAKSGTSGYGVGVKFQFTPDTTNDTAGSVTITKGSQSEVCTYSIAQDEDQGSFTMTLTHVSGETFGYKIVIGEDYSLNLYTSSSTYSEGVLNELDTYMEVSGRFSATDATSGYTLSITLSRDKTASISAYDSSWSFYKYMTCNYTIAANPDGSYAGSLDSVSGSTAEADMPFTLPATFTLDSSISTLTISVTINEVAFTNFALSAEN